MNKTMSFEPVPHREDRSLLQQVDFKWLMAGEGVWVNLTRLRGDAGYADRCIASGLASRCHALRECAAALRADLQGRGRRLPA